MPHSKNHQQRIYSVAKLTAEIKLLLEERFPFIWVEGEISNFNVPVSGHYYFTLKDQHSQISAVMFRGQNRNLKFSPENGMNVVGLGRISLYEPRGTYQIIFEYIEPKGIGEMQIAFEQLKAKLSSEGLFDEKYKQPLPFLPQNLAIITSPTGAVVYDIIKTVNNRFPTVNIQIFPVKVQGDDSTKEIVSAIEFANALESADVIILARGGGTMEDLNAFNSENVARAIFASKIPIISAVGHETDFTIADFVADLRAPTPTAAAQSALPDKFELKQTCERFMIKLRNCIYYYIKEKVAYLNNLYRRIVDPRKTIQDSRLRLDDINFRMIRLLNQSVRNSQAHLSWGTERLFALNPRMRIKYLKENIDKIEYNIKYYLNILLNNKQVQLQALSGKLHALSPAAILERGYSITRTIPDEKIIVDSESVQIGQNIEILLAKGALVCNVGRKMINGKKNI